MLTQRVAAALGVFLLIEGAWGLVSPVVFGVLTTNLLHAVIHLALGATGLWASRTPYARKYLLGVGGLLAVVGVLYFVPGASDLVVSLLNVNQAVAIVNVVIGAACLAAAMMDRRLAST